MPGKQEQELASDEITEVAPGILRMQLPIQFTGLGHVNCYALEDERGFAVVDPGLPGPQSWAGLLDRLGVPAFRCAASTRSSSRTRIPIISAAPRACATRPTPTS